MWDLPEPGLEPVSPALAGGFLTTAPPGKPLLHNLTGVIPHYVHSKEIERQRKTNTVSFHLCVESKKQSKQTNITKQKQTHRFREQTSGCQRRWGLGDEKNRGR